MRALDDHQRAANALCVAACEFNAALAAADRAGLVVDLVVLDSAERPAVRRVVARAMLPVQPVAATPGLVLVST